MSYTFVDEEGVLDDILQAPPDVRLEFSDLVKMLLEDPYPGTSEAADILPLKADESEDLGRFPSIRLCSAIALPRKR